MRRVIALELVGLEKLDCDLYNESGQIIYEKGTPFTPEILMKLSHAKIYKRDEEELKQEVDAAPKKEKEASFYDKRIVTPTPEPYNVPDKAEYKTIFNEKQVEKLVNNVTEILSGIETGQAPEKSVCVEATKIIFEEVYHKVDKVTNIGEMRVHDYYTYTHSINTSIISTIIGRELGFHQDKVKDLTYAALLHDIGKMKIPKTILYKKSRLSTAEFELIKNHAVLGYEFIVNEMKLPDYIARGALDHHERWHGDGYPNGLKGKQISEFGQIIGIADVFDALISERTYKTSVPSNDAIRVMLTEESKSFNPEFFHKFAFMAVVKSVKIFP